MHIKDNRNFVTFGKDVKGMTVDSIIENGHYIAFNLDLDLYKTPDYSLVSDLIHEDKTDRFEVSFKSFEEFEALITKDERPFGIESRLKMNFAKHINEQSPYEHEFVVLTFDGELIYALLVESTQYTYIVKLIMDDNESGGHRLLLNKLSDKKSYVTLLIGDFTCLAEDCGDLYEYTNPLLVSKSKLILTAPTDAIDYMNEFNTDDANFWYEFHLSNVKLVSINDDDDNVIFIQRLETHPLTGELVMSIQSLMPDINLQSTVDFGVAIMNNLKDLDINTIVINTLLYDEYLGFTSHHLNGSTYIIREEF